MKVKEYCSSYKKYKLNGGECQIEFEKRGNQEQIAGKSFTDKPTVRYVHNCKAAKIGLIVTPEMKASKAALYQSISKTCYKHCEICSVLSDIKML